MELQVIITRSFPLLITHCLYTYHTLSVYLPHIVCILITHCLYTYHILSVYLSHIVCILTTYCLYTYHTLSVYLPHIVCILITHCLYTWSNFKKPNVKYQVTSWTLQILLLMLEITSFLIGTDHDSNIHISILATCSCCN